MTQASCGEKIKAPEAPAPGAGRTVAITFTDSTYLDLLPWHDLKILTRDDGEAPIVAETPYYGGMWLPRMIAACAGTAHTNDAEVTALVRAYAEQTLGGRG